MKLDVAGLVNAVDVSEASGYAKIRGDLSECGPDVVDVFWLRVEGVVVDILVVDAVFLTTRNTDFLLDQVREIFATSGVINRGIPSRAIASLAQHA